MKIQTKFFGEISISEDRVLNFKSGIPGFEYLRNYVVLDFEDNANFKCLQSTEESGVCLLMIKPWDYFKDYEIEMSDEEIDELDIKNEQDVIVYNIITVRENKISANLVAPVVINVINKNGRQIILSNAKYDIRQEIKCL